MPVTAPWSPAFVDALNRYQNEGKFELYRCPNKDPQYPHESDVLLATVDGWRCPHCDYTQDWAFEITEALINAREKWRESLRDPKDPIDSGHS